MELTNAPILPLKDYLSGKGAAASEFGGAERLLVIPPWQREYVWKPSDQGEVGVLLQDLQDFVLGNEHDYLMGSVLLSKSDESPKHRLLIDGQQRTLTYSLLLMAVLRHVQNSKQSVHHLGTDEQNAIEDKTLVEMRDCVSGDIGMYVERVSMPHSRANEMLQTVFHWTKMADGEEADAFIADKDHWTQTQRNLLEVAVWIYEKRLKTEEWLPNKDLLRHMRKILDGVKFLQVTLASQHEAIAVFDRINSRGALLDSGDLIKNRIFQSVGDDETFEEISGFWMDMNESLATCSLKRMREPKFLLRALALADQEIQKLAVVNEDEPEVKVSAQKITYDGLTKYWGERLEDKEAPLKARAFAEELAMAGKWLTKLSNEQSAGKKESELRELYFSRYLGSVQHFPVLLAARHIKSLDVLQRLTRQVHNRTAFYLLSEERTQDFEALIPLWTAWIARLGADATEQQLDDVYETHVKVSEGAFDLLIEQMQQWSYTTSDRKKIRAVLSQLTRVVDRAGKKEDKDSPTSYFSTKKDANKESWDIDHVKPKKGHAKDSEVHRIGNLVLLKADHNSLKKAASPLEKQDVYKGSQLLLTQSLAQITVEVERAKAEKLFAEAGFKGKAWDLSNWDSTSMESRTDLYCKLLRHHLSTLD